MATISLDYANVLSEVNRLKAIASELQDLQTQARSALADMSAYWEGAAANAFIVESEQWLIATKALQSEVDSLAVLIKRVADDIREAELRAAAAINGMGGVNND